MKLEVWVKIRGVRVDVVFSDKELKKTKNFVALFQFSKNNPEIILFNKCAYDKAIVLHELFHAYVFCSTGCINDYISSLAMEEISAFVVSHFMEEALEIRDEIWDLRNLRRENWTTKTLMREAISNLQLKHCKVKLKS